MGNGIHTLWKILVQWRRRWVQNPFTARNVSCVPWTLDCERKLARACYIKKAIRPHVTRYFLNSLKRLQLMLYLSCPVRELLKNVLKSHILTKQMWLNLLTSFPQRLLPSMLLKLALSSVKNEVGKKNLNGWWRQQFLRSGLLTWKKQMNSNGT